MVCFGQKQQQGGHLVLVNAPTGADTSGVYKYLESQVPIKVLNETSTYLPGVDLNLTEGGNHHGLERTASLAKSALYLAQNGSVPVLEVRDASQRHLAEVQKLVGKNNATPLTTILMYKPIKDLLADAKGDMGMIQKTLQDYGHMFRGSYEPTHNSIDHLTRAQFDKLFSKLRSGATEDDKVSLKIVKNFMSPLLGLDVQNEVHIEPRYPVYDAVLQFNRFGNSQLAKELVSHLQVGASTRRLSALHRLEGTNVAHVPACTHCQAEMSRSHADLLGNPNGRLQSSLPACGACLGLSRLQLVGSDLSSTEEAPQTVNVADLLAKLATASASGEVVVGGSDSQRLAEVLSTLGVKPAAGPAGSHSLDDRYQLSEEEKGKHWHDIIRYNEVFQKCSKNCNARSESILDQLLYHRIRSLELDIHTQKGSLFWAQEAPVHDWWMSHDTMKGWYENNQFPTLATTLGNIRSFTKMAPNHEVITLWINVNDNFGGRYPKRGHRPDDLDNLLKKHLGAKNIFTPAMLKGTNASIQKGAKAGWPSLSQLQGKIIPVIVEGANFYADAQDLAESKMCFVAQKDVAHKDMIHRHNWNVFFEQTGSFEGLSRDIDQAGFVSRHWVEAQWAHQQSIRKRAHHIATKSLNYHHNTWAKTHTPNGFPFLPFRSGHKGFDSATAMEPQRIMTFRASTGDLWGTNDNAVFASHHDTTPDGKWTEYQWYLTNANSHMQKWARAGIAFRQSKNDEGAAYFSLVRPSSVNLPAQVQLRNEADAKTVAAAARVKHAANYKARVRYNHGQTECEGYYSEDGTNWRLIRSTSIHGRLQHHGLIVSTKNNSHNADGTQYQFVFGNVTKNGKPMLAADFPQVHDMGMVYSVPRLKDGISDEATDMF